MWHLFSYMLLALVWHVLERLKKEIRVNIDSGSATTNISICWMQHRVVKIRMARSLPGRPAAVATLTTIHIRPDCDGVHRRGKLMLPLATRSAESRESCLRLINTSEKRLLTHFRSIATATSWMLGHRPRPRFNVDYINNRLPIWSEINGSTMKTRHWQFGPQHPG